MAKLSKKNLAPKVEESPAPVVPANEGEEFNEDQNAAIEGVMSSATAHAAEVEDDDSETGEKPAVEEHTENEGGENPETAPPPPAPKEDEVVVARPKPSTPVATTVKVVTVCDHTCHIGGTLYCFKKGVPTSVPEPVKKILRDAGLLAAL